MKYYVLIINFAFIFSMTGLELATLMDKRDKPVDIKSSSTMELIKKNGKKRTLKLINKSKDNSTKQMIWFLEPRDDYGIAFLKIENKGEPDYMNMWLPGFKKFRRISSQKKSDSFMGSDLSFEDMTTRDLDEYNFKIVNNSTHCFEESDDKCYILSSVPKDEYSEYSKHLTWVSKNNYITVKEESYDKDSNKLKSKIIKYKIIDKFFIMNELFVENVQKNTSTLLIFNHIKIKNNYENELFHSKNLKRIPLD